VTRSSRPTTSSLRNIVDQCIVESKWEELHSLCIENLKADSRGLSSDEEATLRLGLMIAQYYSGNLLAAAELVSELKSNLLNCDDKSLIANAKYHVGMLYISLGDTALAEDELNESYVFSKHCQDHTAAIRTLNLLAREACIGGKLHKALDYLETCTQYCRQNDLTEMEMSATRNSARILAQLGRLNEAIAVFESTNRYASDTRNAIYVHLSAARIMLMKLDFKGCLDSLRISKDLIDNSQHYYELRLYNEYSGLLQYYRGNYGKAREYYQKVLDIPEPTASAVAQTLRMLTDAYIAEGKFKKATSTAKKAEDAINKIGERIELGALYRAYGQIHTHKGETDTARDYFKKSIDLLKEIGARYELALSYFACGRSESFSRDERTSFLHTARTLFDEMDVPKRVEQVDDAILDLKSSAIPNIIRSKSKDDLPVIIAVNREMKRIIAYAEEVAGSELGVLLTGETGTGKDLLARYIHHKSGRTGKFVPVNAAAIPNELIESELFGCKKGAFTGAIDDKPGRFELADNGTFYLNEIGDATPEFQAKLLEVLEAGQVWRLGESRARKVNFRLIAATNHDLDQRMKKGLFREDLFYRLRQVRMKLPPLSKRLEDIQELVRHFLSQITSLGKENGADIERLGQLMAERNWPGNVRELCAEVNLLWIASQCNIARMVKSASEYDPASEKKQLLQTLQNTGWNRREVARRLGVDEATVRRRMKKYNLP
jgi:DNA-binding NtrC family response regulator